MNKNKKYRKVVEDSKSELLIFLLCFIGFSLFLYCLINPIQTQVDGSWDYFVIGIMMTLLLIGDCVMLYVYFEEREVYWEEVKE